MTIDGKNIHDVTSLSIAEAQEFFESLSLDAEKAQAYGLATKKLQDLGPGGK